MTHGRFLRLRISWRAVTALASFSLPLLWQPWPLWPGCENVRARTEAPGNTSGSSAAFSSSSSPSPSPPQSLTLLVMQPCGGDGEAVGAMLQPQVVQPAQAVSKAPSAQGGLMLFYELGPAGDAEGDSEAGAGATGADGACSPAGGLEDLDDEDESGAQSGGGGGGGCKNCTYEGCNETTTQVAKQRKPWMCKRHRNKMYKDKYKRKKSDQALGSGGVGGGGGAAAGCGNAPCSATAVVAAATAGTALSGSGGRIEVRGRSGRSDRLAVLAGLN